MLGFGQERSVYYVRKLLSSNFVGFPRVSVAQFAEQLEHEYFRCESHPRCWSKHQRLATEALWKRWLVLDLAHLRLLHFEEETTCSFEPMLAIHFIDYDYCDIIILHRVFARCSRLGLCSTERLQDVWIERQVA